MKNSPGCQENSPPVYYRDLIDHRNSLRVSFPFRPLHGANVNRPDTGSRAQYRRRVFMGRLSPRTWEKNLPSFHGSRGCPPRVRQYRFPGPTDGPRIANGEYRKVPFQSSTLLYSLELSESVRRSFFLNEFPPGNLRSSPAARPPHLFRDVPFAPARGAPALTRYKVGERGEIGESFCRLFIFFGFFAFFACTIRILLLKARYEK